MGNGATSTLQNPSTTYISTGTYSVKLTVTYANGTTSTQTKTAFITVYNEPTVDFTSDKVSGCFPAIIQFTDLSTTPAGTNINSWKWDFGDGNTSNQQNPKYTYRVPGTYTVILTVGTDKGCNKVIVKPNYVTISQGVTPSFSYSDPSVCRAPATVGFTNTGVHHVRPDSQGPRLPRAACAGRAARPLQLLGRRQRAGRRRERRASPRHGQLGRRCRER